MKDKLMLNKKNSKKSSYLLNEQRKSALACLDRCKLLCRVVWLERKKTYDNTLGDDWLRGFIEAEASFTQNTKTGKPLFQITQLACDEMLIISIKSKLGVGAIHQDVRDDGRRVVVYSLSNKNNIITHLLPVLEKNFVFSKTRVRYLSWLKVHFTAYFVKHNKVYLSKSLVACDLSAYNCAWLQAFTDGDGSFYFVMRKQKDYKFGYQIQGCLGALI